MRRAGRGLALAALLWMAAAGVLPALAAAAPLSLAEYAARLHAAAAALACPGGAQAARAALGEVTQVQTPGGLVAVDLRPLTERLDRSDSGGAAALLEQYAAAAEQAAGAPQPDTAAARRRLENSLGAVRWQNRWRQALADWWNRVFGRRSEVQIPTSGSAPSASPLSIGALVIGLLALLLLGWSMAANLAATAGAGVVDRRSRSRTGAAARPTTPDDLRAAAREAAVSGDFREALRLTHLAALTHLDRRGLLRYDPALTNREHERQLRRHHAGPARTLRQLNDLADIGLYAGHGATAQHFGQAEELTERLWREGEAASRSDETPGASSSAPSR